MRDVDALLREYFEILDVERDLAARKEFLRNALMEELVQNRAMSQRTELGLVERKARFNLKPRQEPVLNLLTASDLFPFAKFTPNQVKQRLVPIYGRERLLPLFEISKTEYVTVRRSGTGKSTDPS